MKTSKKQQLGSSELSRDPGNLRAMKLLTHTFQLRPPEGKIPARTEAEQTQNRNRTAPESKSQGSPDRGHLFLQHLPATKTKQNKNEKIIHEFTKNQRQENLKQYTISSKEQENCQLTST